MKSRLWCRKLFKVSIGVFCFVVLGIGYFSARICLYGRRVAQSPAQAAIVLSASVWGEEPCPVFRERINHAIDLYRTGRVQILLFTGGIEKGANIAESEVAKQYAIKQGVPASDILMESRSKTTFENLHYAQQVARQHQLDRFLLVSDPLHMMRSMAIATDIGMQAEPSPTPTTQYKTFRSQWGLLVHETSLYLDFKLRHNL